MTEKFGLIRVEREEIGFMQVRCSYEFDGNVFLLDKYILIGELGYVPEIGKRFSIGGVGLVAVEKDRYIGHTIVAKDTSLFWIAYYLIASPVIRTFRMVFARFIMTLAVWNLAEYCEGELPNLECIWRRWRKK